MSYSKVRCPECKVYFDANKKQCECGWKNKTSSQAIPDEMISCSHALCGKQGLKNLNRVNAKEYLCEFHWEEFVLKNQTNPYFQIEAQRILLARQFVSEAKDFGMSNYEYFKKTCSGWGGVKEKLIQEYA